MRGEDAVQGVGALYAIRNEKLKLKHVGVQAQDH